jgi:hypothetical protein
MKPLSNIWILWRLWKWADEIGADGYGANAVEAVALVKNLLQGESY